MYRNRFGVGFVQPFDVVIRQKTETGRGLGSRRQRLNVSVPAFWDTKTTQRIRLGVEVDGTQRDFAVDVPLTPLIKNVDERWPDRGDKAGCLTLDWPVQSTFSARAISLGEGQPPLTATSLKEPSRAGSVRLLLDGHEPY